MDKQFLNKPLCFTTINGFSCQEENQKHFFDLIIVCSIVSFSVMILAAVIMIYRYNYGLFTGFFQYVKGYRIPKPINTLLTVIFISKLSRFISLVLLLFDVPNVARIRVVLNYLGTLPISLAQLNSF
ncbi:hypothetical protein BDF19DRAFT_265979 [Syncephalis fuscata]|nr:hypothetical protein BDF19DRAFT_265979 [Syncephalis fuscata]